MLQAAVDWITLKADEMAWTGDRARAPDPNSPRMRAMAAYRAVRDRLTGGRKVKKLSVSVGEQTFELREMTFGEVRKIRTEGEQLDATWPLREQLGAERLDSLGLSEVEELTDRLYSLTFGPPPSAPGPGIVALGPAGAPQGDHHQGGKVQEPQQADR